MLILHIDSSTFYVKLLNLNTIGTHIISNNGEKCKLYFIYDVILYINC